MVKTSYLDMIEFLIHNILPTLFSTYGVNKIFSLKILLDFYYLIEKITHQNRKRKDIKIKQEEIL